VVWLGMGGVGCWVVDAGEGAGGDVVGGGGAGDEGVREGDKVCGCTGGGELEVGAGSDESGGGGRGGFVAVSSISPSGVDCGSGCVCRRRRVRRWKRDRRRLFWRPGLGDEDVLSSVEGGRIGRTEKGCVTIRSDT
jgi:hypothetical protein